MSTITNYKGAIHDLLVDFFMVKDGFSVGEKLTHLEKQLEKKKYFYASDEEIFSVLTEVIKTDYYTDSEE